MTVFCFVLFFLRVLWFFSVCYPGFGSGSFLFFVLSVGRAEGQTYIDGGILSFFFFGLDVLFYFACRIGLG